MPAIVTCTQCGTSIAAHDAFCSHCGSRQAAAPPSPHTGPGLPMRSVHPVTGIDPVRERRPRVPTPDLQAAHGTRYRSLRRPALLTRGLIGLLTWLAGAFSAVAAAGFLIRPQRIAVRMPDWAPERIESAASALGWAILAVGAVTLAAFAGWSIRGYRNVPALGIANGRLSGAWAVVGWLVPIGGARWHRLEASHVERRWWAPWLVIPATAVISVTLLVDQAGPVQADQALRVVELAAALLLIGSLRAVHDIIGVVSAAQTRRAELIEADRSEVTARGDDLAAYLG